MGIFRVSKKISLNGFIQGEKTIEGRVSLITKSKVLKTTKAGS